MESETEAFWDTIAKDSEIDDIVFTSGFYEMDHGKAYDIARFAFNNSKTISNFCLAREMDYSQAMQEALEILDSSDIFVFRLEDNELCRKYDLYYYFIDELIIGCSKRIGDFETVGFDQKQLVAKKYRKYIMNYQKDSHVEMHVLSF